jgi:TolB-like protein/DNA-binding winged helix-turn-helix (wHTH) protein/Flp pilus assembly protein TadD
MGLSAKHLYRFGAYRLDVEDRLLYKDGELVALPPKVLDTLLLLVASGGRVLTKDEMMKQLWPDTFVEEGTLTQYISVLRKALGEGGSWIENLPRRGYRFTAPVQEEFSPVQEVRIEEHTTSRTVIEEEVAIDHPVRLHPVVLSLVLLTLLAGVAFWMSRRPEPTKPFRSVAVLPFRTVSGSSDYLADGITEALITRLTNLEHLRVVSYSRVRQFKGATVEAAKIGRQLGVEAIIEGTVRVASGRLRISIHGVDSNSGYTIWAIDRFDAEPDRLLDIEGQIAEAAAEKVRGHLTARERDLVTKARATNAEAYDLVLRARWADPQTSVDLLQRAVQLEPGFADTYGRLALAQLRTYELWLAGPEALRKAISNANQALSRDPKSAIAIRALAHIQHTTGRPVEGLLMARRALAEHPDDLDAIAAAAETYFRTGLYDRAIPLFEKALAGEPTSSEFRSQLARLHLFRGQYQKGVQVISPLPLRQVGVFGMLLYAETGQMAKAVAIALGDPQETPIGFTAYIRGVVLAAAGDRNRANEMWAKAVRHDDELLARNENPWGRVLTGILNAKLGRSEAARRDVEQALALDPQHPALLFFAAQARAILGQRRDALDTLKAAVENGFFNLPMIEYHTRPGLAFHALREDPQFRAILSGLGQRIQDLRAQY